MGEVVELPLGDGGSLLVEARGTGADPDASGIDRIGRPGEVAVHASETLQAALQRVQPALSIIAGQIRALAEPPDQVSVQFGITISAQAGVVVAQAATEANFTLTAVWRR